jgi:uncharacterized protein (UPF0276 family)
MKLAINYSKQADQLVQEGSIHVDLFKCPDWPDMIQQASQIRPVAVHFPLNVGTAEGPDVGFERIARLMEETGTHFVNLHLAPYNKGYSGVEAENPSPEQARKVLENALRQMRAFTEFFGPERVILENDPYHGSAGFILRTGAEPEVICHLLEETGCGLLLDISHARISAHYLGVDAKEYMLALPVSRLRELHFTGLHYLDGRPEDHLPILETDWPVLEWVLDKIETGAWALPRMLAFEYGGVGGKFADRSDPEVIAEQVPQLYRLVREV